MTMFLIWSHEHRMWWGPNQRGYTPHLAEAGDYTKSEAGDIVTNVGIGYGSEVAVPTSLVSLRTEDEIKGLIWGMLAE